MKCGAQLPDGAVFCSSCGNRLDVAGDRVNPTPASPAADFGTTPPASPAADFGTTPPASSAADFGTTPPASSAADFGTTPPISPADDPGTSTTSESSAAATASDSFETWTASPQDQEAAVGQAPPQGYYGQASAQGASQGYYGQASAQGTSQGYYGQASAQGTSQGYYGQQSPYGQPMGAYSPLEPAKKSKAVPILIAVIAAVVIAAIVLVLVFFVFNKKGGDVPGTYHLAAMEMSGMTIDISSIPGTDQSNMSLVLRDDGTGTMMSDSGNQECTWELDGEKMDIKNAEGKSVSDYLSMSGGRMEFKNNRIYIIGPGQGEESTSMILAKEGDDLSDIDMATMSDIFAKIGSKIGEQFGS